MFAFIKKKMPKKNKLSIYLIEHEYADNDDKILKGLKLVLGELDGIGTVYYAPSVTTVPKWFDDFYCGKITNGEIYTFNARVALLTKVEMDENVVKRFAITMGYGKKSFGK